MPKPLIIVQVALALKNCLMELVLLLVLTEQLAKIKIILMFVLLVILNASLALIAQIYVKPVTQLISDL